MQFRSGADIGISAGRL